MVEEVDKRFEQVDKRLEHPEEERFFRLQQVLIGGDFALLAALLGTQL
jgi:hypothetical protein